MKEMIYSEKSTKEILHSGTYQDHKFVILTLGWHPTAYVECKLDNCNSVRDERLDNIEVHGGFTYLDSAHWDDKDKTLYLGWDYAHFMDFSGIYLKESFPKVGDYERPIGIKWTTAEIFEEVKSVIEQLKEVEKQND